MFNQNIHLIALFAIIPVIFAALCMIPAFLIGRKMAGNLAGFIATTYIGLHVSILARTTAGFSDTDMYNIFFPLLVVFLIVYAIETEKLWKSVTYSLLAAFTLLVYHTAWPAGWWYMFYFPLAAFGVAFLIKLIQPIIHHKKNKLKLEAKHLWNETSKIIISGATFVIATIAFVTIHSGNLIQTFRELFAFLSFSSIKNAANVNLWPNVYTTVAEMNSGSLNEIISSLGNISMNSANSYIFGIIILIFAAIGIYLLIIKDKKNVSNIGVAAMFAFWAIVSIWASFKGIRFVMFVIAPLGICLGIFFELIIERISNSMHNFMQISKTVTKVSLSIIVALLLVFSMTSLAKVTARNEIPSMDDAWQNTLTKIKNESQPTAIISSWWDFGHEFITVAERGASADGASQNTPQARWLGRILITNDSREAAGMLRMLNCDANKAYDKLFNYTNNTIKSVEILDNTDVMGKSDARKYLLANGLTSSQADDVLLSTHCTPPESFVITSEDMGCVRQSQGCSGKTGVWAHFGLWNFSKADEWLIVSNNDRVTAIKLLMDNKLVADQKEAVNIYNLLSSFSQEQANSWISPWPNYAMPMMTCDEVNTSYFQCQNGAIIDMNNKTAKLSTNNGLIEANSLTYIENGSIKTVQLNAKGQYSIAFDGKQAIIASPDIAQSLFTQLFYLENGGEYFIQFDDQTTVLGDRILVWKVNWDKVLAED